jgi:hypothetical protein
MARSAGFGLAECVPEPSHGEADKERNGFRLAQARHRMRVDPDIHFRIRSRLGEIDQLLPETTAQDGNLSRPDYAQPHTAQLYVSSSHDDR